MRKIISHNRYFAVEMTIGLITFIAVLIFGDVGSVFGSFIAVLAFFKRKKWMSGKVNYFTKLIREPS